MPAPLSERSAAFSAKTICLPRSCGTDSLLAASAAFFRRVNDSRRTERIFMSFRAYAIPQDTENGVIVMGTKKSGYLAGFLVFFGGKTEKDEPTKEAMLRELANGIAFISTLRRASLSP